MWRWIGAGLGLVIVLGGGFVVRTLYVAGQFRSIEPHFSGRCQVVSGAVGPEDLTVHPKTGIVYVSAYDRRAARAGEPIAGGIFAYDPASQPPRLVNLTPDADDSFRPHGISLWIGEEGLDSVFVINHPAPAAVRPTHTVEVFDLIDGALVKRASLSDDEYLVMPNDLVAVGQDRFYLTNTHANPPGRTQTIETYLQLSGARVVFYDGRRFREALGGRVFPDGINVSADGRRLYLAETTRRQISVFDRDPQTDTLEQRRDIPLGTGPDNVEVDADGDLWIGAHPKLLAMGKLAADPAATAPAQVLRVSPESGEVDEIYLNAGDEWSAASVAAVRDRHLFIGQLYGDGILDCTMN